MKKILFVCRHNRFRSKIAEGYFKKINRNRNIKVSSSGVIVGNYPLDKLEVKIAGKFGIKMSGRPKPTTTKLLHEQDLVILAADDVPKDLFNYDFMKGKLVVWKIADDHYDNANHINSIVKQIMKKVDELNEKIESGEQKI